MECWNKTNSLWEFGASCFLHFGPLQNFRSEARASRATSVIRTCIAESKLRLNYISSRVFFRGTENSPFKLICFRDAKCTLQKKMKKKKKKSSLESHFHHAIISCVWKLLLPNMGDPGCQPFYIQAGPSCQTFYFLTDLSCQSFYLLPGSSQNRGCRCIVYGSSLACSYENFSFQTVL